MRSYDLEKEFLHKDNCGKGIIYNKEDGKFDVTIESTSSSDITEHLYKVTYEELVELRDHASLEPGVFYRITDYEFTSSDSEVKSAGHRFDIIVLALDEKTLSEDARAIQHEFTDEEKLIYSEEELHYFDASNLAAWKLKYTLNSKKNITWCPETRNSIGVTLDSAGFKTLYRKPEEDFLGCFAFESDNYIVYTQSEIPLQDDVFYIKVNDELVAKKSYKVWFGAKVLLVKMLSESSYYFGVFLEDGVCSLNNDSYVISGDSSLEGNIIGYAGTGWSILGDYELNFIVLNPEYTCYDINGNQITGILVTQHYSGDNWDNYTWNGNPLIFSADYNYIYGTLYNDNGDSCSYTLTLSKEPEVGDYIEVTLSGDSYTPNYLGEWAIQRVEVIESFIENYTPGNTSFKGVIYGMIDEFENNCEYDFKNALITGKYSPFNPDLFYYTFTNQGSGYVKLKDSSDSYVYCESGKYASFGAIPFRLYENYPYATYLKIGDLNLEEGTDLYAELYDCYINSNNLWDLYAAISDTEGFINEDTGLRLYVVNMYNKHYYSSVSVHNYMVKVLELYEWYIDTLDGSQSCNVYYKGSDGRIKHLGEFTDSWYNGTNELKYFLHYRAWVYDASYLNTGKIINLNYIGLSLSGEGSDFDISIDADTYASSLIWNYSDDCGVKIVQDSYGGYGIYTKVYENDDESFIMWDIQGLPIMHPSSVEWSIYEGDSFKFKKPVDIDISFYSYIKENLLINAYLDSYFYNDILYSYLESLAKNDAVYDSYASHRDLVLYNTKVSMQSPQDTSINYDGYTACCYSNKLKYIVLGTTKYLPKVIISDSSYTDIDANKVFIMDCYCIKASKGTGDSIDKMFLLNVLDSELKNVYGSTIKDSYCIYINDSENVHILNCSNLRINNSLNTSFDYMFDSTIDILRDSIVCHIANSKLYNLSSSSLCGVKNSTVCNLLDCSISNSNSFGNFESNNFYTNLNIDSLLYKNIELTELLQNTTLDMFKGYCTHIRSEEDLTITV